jgi:hypothetical protein
MDEPAKTIARCSKCGRGFVWIAPNIDMIDKYPDQKKYNPRYVEGSEPCGGEIKLLETAET